MLFDIKRCQNSIFMLRECYTEIGSSMTIRLFISTYILLTIVTIVSHSVRRILPTLCIEKADDLINLLTVYSHERRNSSREKIAP